MAARGLSRLARRPSRGEHFDEPAFSGPAPGLAGGRGGDLAGAAPERSEDEVRCWHLNGRTTSEPQGQQCTSK